MESMPGTILGLPANVFLLWVSAAFYIGTILVLWQPLRQEKSDLLVALNAFLYGMAFFHIFLGLGFYLNNLALIHLGSFAALTGSAYTLKFPLSALGHVGRRLGFYLALAVAWAVMVWMLIFNHSNQHMITIVFLYMIVVTGLSGFYTIWVGLKAKEASIKIKCLGGGVGMVTCCFFADILVLVNGVTMLGEVLMSAAPLVLMMGLFLGRRVQKSTLVNTAPQNV